MPCDSTVTRTQMTNEARLGASLTDEGFVDVSVSAHAVTGYKNGQFISFARGRATDPFATTSSNLEAVRAVQRKYSERGVREYAKRAGFSVASAEGRKLTFIKRRG